MLLRLRRERDEPRVVMREVSEVGRGLVVHVTKVAGLGARKPITLHAVKADLRGKKARGRPRAVTERPCTSEQVHARSSAVKRRFLAESSPEETPAYGLARAAQIVHVPESTVRLWSIGSPAMPRLFTPALPDPLLLSFSNLIELFVLASMRRVHGVSLQRVRQLVRAGGEPMARRVR
jgi:hypothetical protein